MKPPTKNFLIQFNKDIFAISMVSFVALFFLELIRPKFVIAYINLNYVLLLCLLSGIIAVIFEKENAEAGNREKIGIDVLLIFSVITFVFIMFFTRDLGVWGALISFVGAAVVFLLGLNLG